MSNPTALNVNIARLRQRFDEQKPFTRSHIEALFNEATALSKDLANAQGQLDAAEQNVKILRDQRDSQPRPVSSKTESQKLIDWVERLVSLVQLDNGAADEDTPNLALLKRRLSGETEARQMQPYLIRLLKEVERIVPPPQNCHHCFTFAQFGSDSAGWTDKLALQINREGRFVCIFVDVDDFQKPPDALASDIAGALSGEPANTQFGVGPGQYTSAVKSRDDSLPDRIAKLPQ